MMTSLYCFLRFLSVLLSQASYNIKKGISYKMTEGPLRILCEICVKSAKAVLKAFLSPEQL